LADEPWPNEFSREQTDRVAIMEVIQRERLARDMKQWEKMASCFSADSYVDISWFQGTGAEFAAASQNLAAGGLQSFHQMGPSVTRIRGRRALADTGCAIHVLWTFDGIDVDVISHARMYTRVANQNGNWLISGIRVAYIHDMMVPLDPTHAPKLEESELVGLPASYRFLSYVHKKRGHPPRLDLPGFDRPATVEALLASEEAWLMDGASATSVEVSSLSI